MYTFLEKISNKQSIQIVRFVAKNCIFEKYFYILHLISFQATTKTIFTKCYKTARVAPSLNVPFSSLNSQNVCYSNRIW